MSEIINESMMIETIRRHLPEILQYDPALRDYIMEIAKRDFASKDYVDDRIGRLINELRQERQEWDRKWEEERREQNRKWEEQNRKWNVQMEENRRIQKFHERAIGALGSRWGLRSERSFRNALAAILQDSFEVEVLNVNEYDHEGMVFGRPDQVEMDVVIRNGMTIICELKSSCDKAAMYIFERKARFFEKQHQRPVTRMLMISPMIDSRALEVAKRLGIEVYGQPEDVTAEAQSVEKCIDDY
ncbi:DUF3782 domain-containing protein [Ectothiorhodospiraceae bacterium BW-2]|nr:DUF3782 domain-containing protein [Ectothiorhodospiraceae bacterium BW-2]